MRNIFENFLFKAFHIREGEVARAILMQLNIFFIISTLLIVKPAINGLFLSEVGIEGLPLAFVLVAIFAVLISTVYAHYLGRVPFIQIILSTLGVSVGLFVLFGLLLRWQLVGGWILYAFYIWVALFGVLTASQFWIMANIVFNVREAKRLFGFIGAGAISGGIFGGYLTSLLAPAIGTENLAFVGALFLLLCFPINIYIWRSYVLATLSSFQRKKRITKSDHPFQIIKRSPHLRYLAGIIGLSVIVAKLVDFQFSSIAANTITDPDQLTAFFGFWFSNFNVLSLVVQLLLTQRLVGTLGVGSSLYFLPISIFVGALLILFAPVLWAAILIKSFDGSLKQSINKAAVELLAIPIPTEVKNKTKTFIDVVVDSIATGIGGLLLIFLINGLHLSSSAISMLIISFILIWVFFVRRIRKSYLDAFRLNVRQLAATESANIDFSNQSVVNGLLKVLQQGDEQQILHVLQKLRAAPDKRFQSGIIPLLQHPSDQVVEESIRNLYFLSNSDLIPAMQELIQHPSQKVKVAAFDYLIEHDPSNVESMLATHLDDASYQVRLAALVALAEESRDNLVLKEKFRLEERLTLIHEELTALTDDSVQHFYAQGLIRALGLAKLDHFFPLLETFATHSEPRVAEEAILAIGRTQKGYFLPLLFDLLKKSKYSQHAAKALAGYGPGMLVELEQRIYQAKSPAMLSHYPKILVHFNEQKASDLLFYLIQQPHAQLRLTALRALNDVKIKNPVLSFYEKEVADLMLEEARLYQHTLSVLYVQRNAVSVTSPLVDEARQNLIRLLEIKLDGHLERMFRLLGLKYPPEEVIPIYHSIRSEQSDLRNNAIEYLDNILESSLKKILLPIIETALLDTITEKNIRQINGRIPKEKDCYNALQKDADDNIRRAVQQLLEVLPQ